MTHRIEIHYDAADIPGVAERGRSAALDFRNAAMQLIEWDLEAADAGGWEGAALGACDICFSFFVEDPARAEAIARAAVAGTPYDCIRAVTHHGPSIQAA